MIKQNLKHSSPEDSTISRQTRNAFIAATLFSLAAIVNFVVSLKISLSTKAIISFADTVAVFIFMLFTIASAIIIRKGQKEKGIWLLLISFVLTLALRNAFTAGLSIVFGTLIMSITPLIGLLTLKAKLFNRTLSLGIISAAFYLVFDILASRYLPHYRQLSETVEPMVMTITVIAIILTLAFIAALFIQLFRKHPKAPPKHRNSHSSRFRC